MRYLGLFLMAPGSFALIALAGRAAARKFRGWREADEDEARRKRFASENAIPEEFVVIPTGKRPAPPQDRPEIASRYTETVKS